MLCLLGNLKPMARKKSPLGHSHMAPVEMAPYGDAEEPKDKGKLVCNGTPESTIQVCMRRKKAGPAMNDHHAVCHHLSPTMGQADREHFVVLHLNARHQIMAQERVSTGSATGVEVHPREIFKAAIANNSVALIVAHNHPSGEGTPSRADLDLTERMKKAGEMLGIPILDHVIIGSKDESGMGACTSLAEKGYLGAGYSTLTPDLGTPKAKRGPGKRRA